MANDSLIELRYGLCGGRKRSVAPTNSIDSLAHVLFWFERMRYCQMLWMSFDSGGVLYLDPVDECDS